MSNKPFPQSFWVRDGLLCAGCYPGAPEPAKRDEMLRGLLDCGIGRILSLMEADEKSNDGVPFEPYEPRLRELAGTRSISVECLRLPIPDASVPTRAAMQRILDELDDLLEKR